MVLLILTPVSDRSEPVCPLLKTSGEVLANRKVGGPAAGGLLKTLHLISSINSNNFNIIILYTSKYDAPIHQKNPYL